MVLTNGERSVQFRHHLLFDYVTSRVFLDADGIVDGTVTFPKTEGVGLVLGPAMGFLLQALWSEDQDHNRFWTAIGNLVGASDCDPVIRSVAARMAAELPVLPEDVDAFARAINAGVPTANFTLARVAGAVAVRLEDEPGTALAPWVNLELQLSARPATVAGVLRMLAFMLIDRVQDPAVRADLGAAVRALLAHGYGLDDSRTLATPAIGFVADTITTGVNDSVALLRNVLTDDRFDRFGTEELPALARKINVVATASPEFAIEVYESAFARQVTDSRQTSMGGGRILNLTSNARQDFEHARWSLKEYFPRFLAAWPVQATQALLAAMAGYVERQHPISEGLTKRNFLIQNTEVSLQPDYSYIWAHEPHPRHAEDALALLSQFENWLETGDEATVLTAAEYAVQKASLAVIWSRLFMAAAARGGALADLLRPYGASPEFLITSDTRKDAIDLLATQYHALPMAERSALEQELIARPFDDFADPDRAKEGFVRRLFGAIGADRLATEAARAVLAGAPEGTTSNHRLITITTGWGADDDYDWLDQESRAEPVVRETIDQLEVVRQALHLEINNKEPIESLESALAALAGLKARLDARAIPDQTLIRRTEDTFAQGVHKVVSSDYINAHTSAETVIQLLDWIEEASRFSTPEVDDDMEAQFENSGPWSSPLAQLEAAEAALDLCLKRPETYPSLTPLIDRMLFDPHPAVRMNAAIRLVRIWDIDRTGFWVRAQRVIENEQNWRVLDLFITETMSTVVRHGAAREVADLVLPLVERCPAGGPRSAHIREHLVQLTLQFWIRFDFPDAAQKAHFWFASAVDNVEEVRGCIQWLRDAYTVGLRGAEDPAPAPHRKIAIALMAQAVEQATEVLTHYSTLTAPSEAETARARSAMQIAATSCQELYFSSDAFPRGDEQKRPPMTLEGSAIFLHETAPILRQLGKHGDPHTVYYLIQLLEPLLSG
ncbi:hypothetical protein [Thiocapsa sp. UBA6158]|uniref:hypothetical protein n=1 Tax=Thiocapsa sp. UBA6158 TaxID=1947692 RepID=UPI0025D7E03E|nr:hypothetical protein [Thiocapsa sp. UBA6158]